MASARMMSDGAGSMRFDEKVGGERKQSGGGERPRR
jgi:hypothetical protein